MDPEDSSVAEARLQRIVREAYRTTRERFETARKSPDLAPYVVPASTAPQVGFAILYTPFRLRPPLLIIGQNPANFAGPRRLYFESPNKSMLSGEPPAVNSYLEHDHEFAATLRKLFVEHRSLLESAVGMNVWHFQQPAGIRKLPSSPLLKSCAETTLRLIHALEPRAILCTGAPARDVCSTTPFKSWHVPHLTAWQTRDDAAAAIADVLPEIEAHLSI